MRNSVDRRQFTKKLAGIDLAQQHLTARRLDHDPDRTAHDEKHIVTCILIIDQPLTDRYAAP